MFWPLLYSLISHLGCIDPVGAKSTSVIATFDNLTSAPFFASPKLGPYGGYGESFEGPPGIPRVPTPYQGLAWTHFFVMNNETAQAHDGVQHATPLLIPCSGGNVAMGYRHVVKGRKHHQPLGPRHFLSLNYTGNKAKSFALTSFCAACFIDIDGAAKGHAGIYHQDEKTAVDCDLKFTARKTPTSPGISATFNYTNGCVTNVTGCTEEYRPMLSFHGSAVTALGRAYEVEVEIVKAYYTGSVDGYFFTGRKALMLALDSVKYTLYS